MDWRAIAYARLVAVGAWTGARLRTRDLVQSLLGLARYVRVLIAIVVAIAMMRLWCAMICDRDGDRA
jgi:hypothetical protein